VTVSSPVSASPCSASADARATYCRIGERSAHTWFVLHELLGKPEVKNYDGSWTEWGSLVGVPIARGD
jgi:thiosulfate/3-mercaptopyruvate sulfurtransferase